MGTTPAMENNRRAMNAVGADDRAMDCSRNKRHLGPKPATTSEPTRARGYGNGVAPSSRALSVFVLLAGIAALGCGGADKRSVRPEPALAQSAAAQRQFRSLERRWLALPPERRGPLEADLRAFVAQHAGDRRARGARVLLAWLRAQQGDVAGARELARQTASGPNGVARDAAVIVEAAVLVRQGRAEAALARLRPLVGKVVDAEDRRLFGEQIVLAALAASRWDEAVTHMIAWLAHADEHDRELVTAAVEAQLLRVPRDALERSLVSLDAASKRTARDESSIGRAREWMRKASWRMLATDALDRGDPSLASRLLESGPPRIHSSDLGRRLARLSTGGGVQPSIAGRTVGLLLTLSTDAARRRSAEVAAGMSRALGLPASAARADAVKLVIRDDSSGLERGLAELAGEGASILVAGMDDATRARAAAHAEAVAIPVVIVGDPSGLEPDREFAFAVGESRAAADDTLRQALAQRGFDDVPVLGAADAACLAGPAAAARSRFPFVEWKRRRVDAVLVTADAECASDVLREAQASGYSAMFALGLDAASLVASPRVSLPLVAVGAGAFPFRRRAPAPDELTRWAERYGAPTWSETLGHDVARLAAAALADFPLTRVSDAKEVAELHRRAARQLSAVTADLWSTEAKGFSGARTLSRTLRTVDR